MTDKRIKMLTPLVVAVLGVVAYWSLVTASPLVPIDRKLAKHLSHNAATNSNEEKSLEERLNKLEERLRHPWARDRSDEVSTEDNSAEIKIFSAQVVSKVDTENGTIAYVANVQKWKKKVYNTTTDATVMYFLDEDGDVDLTNATIRAAAGNVPCNNLKHQFYREADRCNGIYQCDDNGEDERNCESKCVGFRYTFVANISDCKAYLPRYFFDFEKHVCTYFIYGGCAKVVNMFLSKFECERECANVTWPVTTTTTTEKIDVTAAADVKMIGSGESDQVPGSGEAAVIAPSEVKVFGETATTGVDAIASDEQLLSATTVAEPVLTTESEVESSGDAATPATSIIAAVEA